MLNPTISIKYECRLCANRGTPLCELCTVITHPDGSKTRPKHFVRHTQIPLEAVKSTDRAEWLAQYVEAHLQSRTPIPLEIVMKYNEIFQEVT